MDIAAASMDLAQMKLADKVGASLLSKSLKGMEDQGAALAGLLESAAPVPPPHAEGSGAKIDLLA